MANYPRSLAVRVLVRVLSEKQSLDEALDAISGEVDPSLQSWLQEVCSGTLRWKGRLDSILDLISTKKKPSGWLRKILLLSAYQIIVQDRISVPAVVFETVTEVKLREGEAPARFVNACLRKIAEHREKWRAMPFPQESLESQAAWASLPNWLWKRLVEQQGLAWAQAYAQASLERPTLWIRSRERDWKSNGVIKGPIDYSWKSIEGGAIHTREGFQKGDFFVQDISSQTLIHEITQKVQGSQKSLLKALDLCAAPGGKSAGLAWNGFDVTSTDHNEARLVLLKDTVSRVCPQIKVKRWDDFWNESSNDWDFDLVWVDAPCSGTGILRRHPDVRWLRQEKELKTLAEVQQSLLKKAWNHLRPGSYLVYSVCSVLREEGPEAIQKAGLDEFKVTQWSLCPQDSPYGDGFWAALLKK